MNNCLWFRYSQGENVNKLINYDENNIGTIGLRQEPVSLTINLNSENMYVGCVH